MDSIAIAIHLSLNIICIQNNLSEISEAQLVKFSENFPGLNSTSSFWLVARFESSVARW